MMSDEQSWGTDCPNFLADYLGQSLIESRNNYLQKTKSLERKVVNLLSEIQFWRSLVLNSPECPKIYTCSFCLTEFVGENCRNCGKKRT